MCVHLRVTGMCGLKSISEPLLVPIHRKSLLKLQLELRFSSACDILSISIPIVILFGCEHFLIWERLFIWWWSVFRVLFRCLVRKFKMLR